MIAQRIFMTGVTSIHGWPIYKRLKTILPPGQLFAIRPPKMLVPRDQDVRSLCITDKASLVKIREEFRPDYVIHAAGVCDLDVCEDRPQWAHDLNVNGSRCVAQVFGATCHIIYLGSDLVFSGNNPPRDGYSEEHKPDPVSVAGKTLAGAELIISKCPRNCIVRLGLPLGDSLTGDKGAIDWVESRFKKNLPVTLFHDEIRSCVQCDEIANNSMRSYLSQGNRALPFRWKRTDKFVSNGTARPGKGSLPRTSPERYFQV